MEKVFVRAIIEFSNICKKDCNYCGIRKSANNIKRYVMSEEDILNCVKLGYRVGFRTFVLQSGESEVIKIDRLCFLIDKIKSLHSDIAITLSIGEKSYSQYLQLFNAGADRYLLRFETANRKVFQLNHPDDDFDYRFECLSNLKSIGYEVGSGFLIGLPFEEPDDVQLNLDTLFNLNLDMAGVGPFIPCDNTIYKDMVAGDLNRVLSVYKKIREKDGSINLAAVTALDNLDENGRMKALLSGANVYMPNITPKNFKENYNLYNRKSSLDDIENLKNELDLKISAIGKKIAWNEIGQSFKYLKRNSTSKI